MKKRVVALVLALALAMGLTGGMVFAADDEDAYEEIAAGEEYTYEIELGDDEYEYITLSFSPEESGAYSIGMSGADIYSIYVYVGGTSYGDIYAYEDYNYEYDDNNDDIISYFEAGVTYFIRCYLYESGTFSVYTEPYDGVVAVNAEYIPAEGSHVLVAGYLNDYNNYEEANATDVLIGSFGYDDERDILYDADTGELIGCYYCFYAVAPLAEGDRIIVTFSDGSTEEYEYKEYEYTYDWSDEVYTGYGWFDSDENRINIDNSSTAINFVSGLDGDTVYFKMYIGGIEGLYLVEVPYVIEAYERDLDCLASVSVDGALLTEGTDYTVTGGVEVVTISESYIKSLDSDTTHEVVITFEEYTITQTLAIGYAETSASSEDSDSGTQDSASSDNGSEDTAFDDSSDSTSSVDAAADTDDASEASSSLSIIDSETTASYTLGSGSGATVAVDADIETFVSVSVDGTVLTQDTDYAVTEGSTIITFTESFLETLSEGDHDVTIEFNDGTVQTTLVIEAAETSAESSADTDDSEESDSAEVGDASDLALWMALGLLAVLGLAGAGLRKKAAR